MPMPAWNKRFLVKFGSFQLLELTVILNFKPLPLQIKKARVDNFSSESTWVPECVLLLQWCRKDKTPEPLKFKMKLLGTGMESSFFRILYNPDYSGNTYIRTLYMTFNTPCIEHYRYNYTHKLDGSYLHVPRPCYYIVFRQYVDVSSNMPFIYFFLVLSFSQLLIFS